MAACRVVVRAVPSRLRAAANHRGRCWRGGDGALAAGRIDEEKLAALLTGTLPRLAGGDEGEAWVPTRTVQVRPARA